jgi:phosphatidylinositol alpha 1,6-mannosyltransferase
MEKQCTVPMTEAEQVELGLSMMKQLDRPADSDLRILFFTATYFVLDGVTLTIRRIESHLRANGAAVKILSTVPDDIPAEELKDVIAVPGIKIPFTHAGAYAFGVGLDEDTIDQIKQFKPNVVHFTVPDLVAMDGLRWCQKNNIAYIATWHSNYCDYLRYYFLEWVLGPALNRYLKGFYEQVPSLYVPTPYVSLSHFNIFSATLLK